jgi:hypothetical protein
MIQFKNLLKNQHEMILEENEEEDYAKKKDEIKVTLLDLLRYIFTKNICSF